MHDNKWIKLLSICKFNTYSNLVRKKKKKKKAFENLIFNFYLPGKTLMTSRNPDYM